MKILELIDEGWRDYDDHYRNVVGVFIVPDDFVIQDAHQQWDSETGIPTTGKNQYGTWTSKIFAKHTKSFHDWIAERYEKVEIIEWDV